MRFAGTKKTPVAVLGGLRDEGLEYPNPKKEQENMHQTTVPTRFQLDERSRIDVEPIGEYVELTITTVDDTTVRSTFGMAFTASEARKLAEALLDASAPTLGQSPVDEVEEHARVARKAVLPMTPAKFAKQMREAN